MRRTLNPPTVSTSKTHWDRLDPLLNRVSAIITIGGGLIGTILYFEFRGGPNMPSFWEYLSGNGFFIFVLLLALGINTIITLIVNHRSSLKQSELDNANQELVKAKEELDDLNKECENKELKELIQPLYLAFDKYPEDPKVMQREKFGLPLISSLMLPPSEKVQKYLNIEKADPVIDILQRYGNLAQPALLELTKQFLDFKQTQKEKGISMNDPYFIDTANKVNQIKDLVIVRYNELMWGKKES
jgi:hypothetical protein